MGDKKKEIDGDFNADSIIEENRNIRRPREVDNNVQKPPDEPKVDDSLPIP